MSALDWACRAFVAAAVIFGIYALLSSARAEEGSLRRVNTENCIPFSDHMINMGKLDKNGFLSRIVMLPLSDPFAKNFVAFLVEHKGVDPAGITQVMAVQTKNKVSFVFAVHAELICISAKMPTTAMDAKLGDPA